MAHINIPEEKRTVTEPSAVSEFLAARGITYERWVSPRDVPPGASAETVLEAYSDKIQQLKDAGGYTAADVIDVTPATPNLDVMLAKFNREHWHDEDEVRFIVEGRGLFHVSPKTGPVFAIEVGAGDLIRVPRGTLHWFDLCAERRIRAIRLFQDPSGWTPHYTESGVDANFQPVCFGGAYISAGGVPASGVTVSLSALHIRAIVLDIEGTTTPVDFVYKVLFPYARAHAAEYLSREWESRACQEAVALLCEERGREEGGNSGPAVAGFSAAAAADYVASLMDQDRKSRGLKMLQGLVWEEGYGRGELHGQVYLDVAPALERWTAQGLRVCIYSSGSVLAQQLLFGSTSAGDLRRFLVGHFDTAVGPKTSADSYTRLVRSLGVAASDALFVSDVEAELDAASVAGMSTALCVRPGAANPPAPAHLVIHSFAEIAD